MLLSGKKKLNDESKKKTYIMINVKSSRKQNFGVIVLDVYLKLKFADFYNKNKKKKTFFGLFDIFKRDSGALYQTAITDNLCKPTIYIN